ncbi:hypothetical protein STEG23_036420, partial [Scotinomys teguina]
AETQSGRNQSYVMVHSVNVTGSGDDIEINLLVTLAEDFNTAIGEVTSTGCKENAGCVVSLYQSKPQVANTLSIVGAELTSAIIHPFKKCFSNSMSITDLTEQNREKASEALSLPKHYLFPECVKAPIHGNSHQYG